MEEAARGAASSDETNPSPGMPQDVTAIPSAENPSVSYEEDLGGTHVNSSIRRPARALPGRRTKENAMAEAAAAAAKGKKAE